MTQWVCVLVFAASSVRLFASLRFQTEVRWIFLHTQLTGVLT